MSMRCIVAQPSAITGIATLITKAPLGVLKDQLLVRSLDSYAAYLPKAFDQEAFSFYGTTLVGHAGAGSAVEARRSTFTTGDARATTSASSTSQRYFPPETKAAADELVQQCHRRDGPADRQPRLDEPGDQGQGARQARRISRPRSAIPSQWHDYSGSDDPLATTCSATPCVRTNSSMTYNVGKLGQPIHRWEWGMTPMTVNAYANFGMVEIVFPAAILQPPFFDPNADPAVNYGGIGAVIGHELSHHFDDQGAKYDDTGRLADWWTPADVAAFQARGWTSLSQQYDAYETLPGHARPGQA